MENSSDVRKNLKVRMLSLLDISNFREAALESIHTNYDYLYLGILMEQANPTQFMLAFLDMLKNQQVDHYGVFEGKQILGHVAYSFGMTPLGTELMGWTRASHQNQGIGEFGLEVATKIAFEHKKFNFVELRISEKNLASRTVAEKVGFKPVLRVPYSAEGDSGCWIMYLKVSPRVKKLARQFGRREIDLINCPATNASFVNWLAWDSVVEFYEWPFGDQPLISRPTNYYAFSDYIARVNLSPRSLEENQDLSL
jgi:RimJ/RimL family protein N-acetyltransferase